MVIRNTSRYPTDEVRRLVKLATSDLDMSRVCVNVKNLGEFGRRRGRAYSYVPAVSNAPPGSKYLVVLRLAPPERFPQESVYYTDAGPRWPRVTIADWREALIHIAAHEGLHIEQFREGLRRSELKCERFAERVLNNYRSRVAHIAALEAGRRPTAPEGTVGHTSTIASK